MITRLLLVLSLGSLLAGCAGDGAAVPPPSTAPPTLWAVDLVRTLPGAQEDYLASIRTNWAAARRVAHARGAVRSYRALVAPPDSARGWDVMLMTEYADSAAFRDREETFRAIFASPDFVMVPPARPSAEMRTFAAGEVQLTALTSGP